VVLGGGAVSYERGTPVPQHLWRRGSAEKRRTFDGKLSREATRVSGGRANMAHVKRSRPDPSLGFQVNVLKIVLAVPFALGRGGWLGVPQAVCRRGTGVLRS